MAVEEDSGAESAFLVGKSVYLRPFEREDLKSLRAWWNDPETRGLVGGVKPMSKLDAEEWLERSRSDQERVWFAVVLKQDDRLIGEAGLLRMFPAWRTTDLTMIIGEKDARGNGYGTEAITLLLDFAFGHLNFHRVSIGVVGFNERALAFYERVGFKREGIQRDGYYFNHCYHDFVMMSILADEYGSNGAS